jgi:hypothetical protein
MQASKFAGRFLAAWLACACSTALAADADFVAGKLRVLNDNGGWCWFQGERALIRDGKLYFGSVANGAGPGGTARDGSVEVTACDLATGHSRVFVLHERLENDDHDAPGLYVRRDGRLLAVYGQHGSTPLQRWRITDRPGDVSAWAAEQSLAVGAGYTYSNVYRLAAEGGRLYNFHRGVNFNPNYCVSEDDGSTWAYGGHLLFWQPGRLDPLRGGGRPYVRYAGNGRDTIHLFCTEDHPRNFANSLYHGFLRGGKIHRSDGTVVGELSHTREASVRPTDLTRVFAGDADRVGWCLDIRLDRAGHPYVAFSVRRGDAARRSDPSAGGEDLRYGYGRWDGSRWHAYEIAHAGSRLYSPEVDYSGLVALHPYDPNVLFLSTNADPRTGEPLRSAGDGRRHYEIFKGVADKDGMVWSWTPITRDSTVDNLRPLMPPADDGRRTALLWLRGTYRTYRHYNLRVVGLIPPP